MSYNHNASRTPALIIGFQPRHLFRHIIIIASSLPHTPQMLESLTHFILIWPFTFYEYYYRFHIKHLHIDIDTTGISRVIDSLNKQFNTRYDIDIRREATVS